LKAVERMCQYFSRDVTFSTGTEDEVHVTQAGRKVVDNELNSFFALSAP